MVLTQLQRGEVEEFVEAASTPTSTRGFLLLILKHLLHIQLIFSHFLTNPLNSCCNLSRVRRGSSSAIGAVSVLHLLLLLEASAMVRQTILRNNITNQ
jgi:hypothetical protein